LCAFVQLKAGAVATADELVHFVTPLVADFKKPRELYLLHELGDLPEIPKGPSKKVLYRELRAYYARRFPPEE
jgi:acyl-coenzyme A synthetase/AMP-(fatty) acid ligase